ncbi:MAG: TIGR02757 family protein [Rhodothermaceae bacterium]|nr:TIGR02757 family protein [Rhodothermaceae bacterium]
MATLANLKLYLDGLVDRFEKPEFIHNDPIVIPHSFEDPLDQEIIGLYAALLAWGQRKTLLKKLEDLCEIMSYKPRKFVYDFDPEKDAHLFANFIYRTFQPVDAVSLTTNISLVIKQFGSLEIAFSSFVKHDDKHIGNGLQKFSDLLFAINPATPTRVRKHLARPLSGSACKRFCMYLRWVSRPGPVDLGIWNSLSPEKLVLPLDVHSGRQARALGMLNRKNDDWRAVLELTDNCRYLCPEDPCKYDFAFFGLGVNKIPIDPDHTGTNKIDVTSISSDY